MMKVLMTLFLFFCLFQSAFATNWYSAIREARAVALAEHKLIVVDFWATWCGPCKKMEQDVWHDKEVQEVQSRFVSVKLDVDYEKKEANKYFVKGLPTVLILDGLGNVVHRTKGYMNKTQMINLLKGISADVQLRKLSQISSIYIKNPEDAMNNLILAKVYQFYMGKTRGVIQRGFLHLSITYFGKARKIANKAKNKNLVHAVMLTKAENGLILKREKRAIKTVSKLLSQELSDKNKSLAYFILIQAHRARNETKEAAHYEKLLQEMPLGERYLKKLK